MLRTINIRLFFSGILLFTLLFSYSVLGGEATDRIKATTDKLIEIVTNHEFDRPEMADLRGRMIREAVDMAFDWDAFSRRAMGRHWRKLSKEEKKEFVLLFGQLLERTYMDKTRHYSGERIKFISEETDEKYGAVEAIVTTQNGMDIAVEYRVMKKNDTWFVYDVYVEGVSLVNNYRVQFNRIMIKSSCDELLRRLKTKLDE